MEILRAISIILAVAGLIIYLLLGRKHPKARLYLVAPISWLVFVLIFLIASHGNQAGLWKIEPITLNIWSTSVRLYTLLLVVGIGIVWLTSPKGEIPNEHR